MPTQIYKMIDIDLGSSMKFIITDRRKLEDESLRLEFGYQNFERFQDATEAIDRKLKAQEELSRQELVKRPVLGEAGEPLVVKGIHASRGVILFKPSSPDTQRFYPAVPWIKTLLEEHARNVARNQEIYRILSDYRMSSSPSYSQRHDAPADRYATIIKEIDDLTKIATDKADAAA